MKRKLFIGSSLEGESLAKRVKSNLDNVCGDWLNSETWKEGKIFAQNISALSSLVSASRRFDYGIFVASKDDKLISRLKKYLIPRDNVMFEMGMFLGSLGLTRAFLLVESGSKLPSDYNGITVAKFKRNDSKSIDEAIGKIVSAIESTRHTYNLKPVPSAALAIGYFSNFIQPLAKKRTKDNVDFKLEVLLPSRINDIRTEITAYKRKNPSIDSSVYGDNQRPVVNEHENDLNHYWDIPSTLTTLNTMIDILLHSQEVGASDEKRDWIEHELRNFAGTIEMMVNGCSACKGNVVIDYLN